MNSHALDRSKARFLARALFRRWTRDEPRRGDSRRASAAGASTLKAESAALPNPGGGSGSPAHPGGGGVPRCVCRNPPTRALPQESTRPRRVRTSAGSPGIRRVGSCACARSRGSPAFRGRALPHPPTVRQVSARTRKPSREEDADTPSRLHSVAARRKQTLRPGRERRRRRGPLERCGQDASVPSAEHSARIPSLFGKGERDQPTATETGDEQHDADCVFAERPTQGAAFEWLADRKKNVNDGEACQEKSMGERRAASLPEELKQLREWASAIGGRVHMTLPKRPGKRPNEKLASRPFCARRRRRRTPTPSLMTDVAATVAAAATSTPREARGRRAVAGDRVRS